MPVDLILSDASLLKRRFKNDAFRILAQEFTEDEYGSVRALGYLELYGFSLEHVQGDDHPWRIAQYEYFKLVDFISLLVMSHEVADTVLTSDPVPFRLKLAATNQAAVEFIRIQTYYGICDDNSYIDNHYNIMCFTTEGIKCVIRILEDQLESVYENFGA